LKRSGDSLPLCNLTEWMDPEGSLDLLYFNIFCPDGWIASEFTPGNPSKRVIPRDRRTQRSLEFLGCNAFCWTRLKCSIYPPFKLFASNIWCFCCASRKDNIQASGSHCSRVSQTVREGTNYSMSTCREFHQCFETPSDAG
jgi:hypothetical protein